MFPSYAIQETKDPKMRWLPINSLRRKQGSSCDDVQKNIRAINLGSIYEGMQNDAKLDLRGHAKWRKHISISTITRVHHDVSVRNTFFFGFQKGL